MADTDGRSSRSWKRILLWVIGALIAVFILIQFVPYGHDHSNPPAGNAFRWSDPQAEAIARRSCYDCHSNETKWWWATNIAPMSWLVQSDVDGAREALDFSDWTGDVDDLRSGIEDGMPPFQYTLIHPDAKLSDAEKQTLIDGYTASLPANQPGAPSGGQTSTPTPDPSSGDATAIIDARCSQCHSADGPLNFRAASAAEAQALIDQMVQRGATITADEQQVLVDYFTR
jgi:hypothetical protein